MRNSIISQATSTTRARACLLAAALLPAILLPGASGCRQNGEEVEILPSPPPPADSPQRPAAPTEGDAGPAAPPFQKMPDWHDDPPQGWEPSREEELLAARAAAGESDPGAILPGLALAEEFMRRGHPGQALAAVQSAVALQDLEWARDIASGVVYAGVATPEDWLPDPLSLMARAGMWMALDLEALAPGRLNAARYPPVADGVHHDPLRAGTVTGAARRLLGLQPQQPAAAWYLRLATDLSGEGKTVSSVHGLQGASSSSGFTLTATPLSTELNPQGPAGDIAVADFNLDGQVDILMTSFLPIAGVRLLAGESDGPFHDVSMAAGLASFPGGTHLRPGDVDGDGDTDLLIFSRITTVSGTPFIPLLLRNDGGVFSQVKLPAGDRSAAASAATWLDHDDDGDLDLFLATPNGHLLIQEPAWVFREVETDPIFGGMTIHAALARDVNGDGRDDLYVIGPSGDRLYMNQGERSFDRGQPVLGPWSQSGAVCFLDGDGDGDQDLLLVPGASAALSVARTLGTEAARHKPVTALPRLMLNMNGSWRQGDGGPGLLQPMAAGALACTDLDGDGDDDIYVASDDHGKDLFLPHRVLLQEDHQFVDVTASTGGGLVLPGRAVQVVQDPADRPAAIYVLTGSQQAVRPRLLIRLTSP